jgi:hypothetical protein
MFGFPSERITLYIFSLWGKWWSWRELSSGIQLRIVRWKTTDDSEEHIAFFFRVEEQAEWYISVKAGAGSRSMWRRNVPAKRRLTLKRLRGGISQKTVLFINTAMNISSLRTDKAVPMCNSWSAMRRGCVRSGGIAPPLFISALDVAEGLVARTSRYTLRKMTPVTHWICGWVGPRTLVDPVE